MKNSQFILGLGALVILLTLAFTFLEISLFYRFLIGLAFGYVMVRATIGFAGSVNRLSRTGSAQLANALLLLFVITAIFNALLFYEGTDAYKLNLYPINLGLILGGLMFGFGMTFSSCCATGSLTDLAGGFSRASVTIIFFSIGVFLGYDFQANAPFVITSWFSSASALSYKGGVFLPDLFLFDGFNGYLGAVILTILLALFFSTLATKYANTLSDLPAPKTEKKVRSLYETVFVNNWNMHLSVVLIALLFLVLLLLSNKGWSASSTFGKWFGKFLMNFGFSAQSLSDYTSRSVEFFSTPLLQDAASLQNLGIVLGALFSLLLAGTFGKKFIDGLKINTQWFFIYAFGGLIMGFGTRLSNGCNVGALYTPIAEFSLSGWLYLIVVVIGGFSGNWFLKRYISPTCSI